MKYAFYSPDYHPVVLENEENITETGLKFVNHDMCYSSVLITGQMIEAIRKLNVDQARIRLLMLAAGDACRGLYPSLQRKLPKVILSV